MCGLFLCEIIKGFHHYARILIFLSCFGIYSDFSYFLAIFPALGLVLGAVLEIFAVSATFLAIFSALGLNLGCCFKRFRDYSSPRSAYYTINPL